MHQMVKQTTSNFNILSGKDNAAIEPKVIQEVKEDLFEALEAQEKLVNRNRFAKALSVNRYENGTKNVNIGIPAGKVKI